MSIFHTSEFPGAGKTYTIKSCDPVLNGATIRVEDYWDRVMGSEFWTSAIHPMGPRFMLRREQARFPMNEEIVYGKDQHGFGVMVHVTELGEVSA